MDLLLKILLTIIVIGFPVLIFLGISIHIIDNELSFTSDFLECVSSIFMILFKIIGACICLATLIVLFIVGLSLVQELWQV